jgi:hypothetical protein
MMQSSPEDYERSAAGLDFDSSDPVSERAAKLGAKMAESGPEVLLDEIENLLPEQWRDNIRQFPIAAMAVGIGVGLWLGMKKSEEIIAAGSSLISAAAMANVSQVMDRVKGE